MVDILLAEHRVTVHPSTSFNLESSTGFSNLQIVEAARKVTGHPILLEIANRRLGNPDTLIVSPEKVRDILGWQPKFDNIKTNIQTALAWHFSHPDGYKIDKKKTQVSWLEFLCGGICYNEEKSKEMLI